MIIFAMADCQAKMTVDKEVRIHVVEDFAGVSETLNSHEGSEKFSALEPMFDYVRVIPDSFLTAVVPDSAPEQKSAVYPRIKRMADGRYIMFYQGGRVASRIMYSLSDDLRTWTEPVLLWKPYAITTVEGKDTRRFTTADAVVLPDGEILVVCSYRASKGYKKGIGCGLVLRRSSDNGQTWSEPEVIYEGPNWEPYLLYLPGGDIHCYFTDCVPAIRDSGTSVVVSRDGGRTWGEYRKISRQFKYVSDGHMIFTDQMPSVRLLNDGRTLCGFFESRLEPDFPAEDAKSTFMMSLVYNDGYEWEDLGNEKEGPKDRQTNLFMGAGGYISVFPSGETLISCNISGKFSMKLGDADARRFNGRDWDSDWLQPFEERGYWGATEVVSAHEAVGAIYAPEGLSVGKFYLNHAMDAHQEAIVADGDAKEWNQQHVFFLGSDSSDQAVVRAAYDRKNLYVLVERKTDATDAAYTDIRLHKAGAAGRPVHARVSAKGLDECSVSGSASACEGLTADGQKGVAVELAVPLSALGLEAGDEVMLDVVLRGNGLNDGFTHADGDDPSTWMKIRLR